MKAIKIPIGKRWMMAIGLSLIFCLSFSEAQAQPQQRRNQQQQQAAAQKSTSR